MACPLCGELCTCAAGRSPSSARDAETIPSHVAVLIDPESLAASEQRFEASLEQPPPTPEASVREVPLSEMTEAVANDAASAPQAPVAVAVSELPPAPSAPPAPLASSRAPFYRPEDASTWRQEVSSRVDSFRSRRRGRYDPNSSLSLNFDTHSEVAEQPQAQPQFRSEERRVGKECRL